MQMTKWYYWKWLQYSASTTKSINILSVYTTTWHLVIRTWLSTEWGAVAQMREQPLSLMRWVLFFFTLSLAKEERLAKGKEKKEGATKWSQGTSNRICPVPQWTERTHAGSIPWLTFSRNHQETWSRVDTTSPKWQTGNFLGFPCIVN